VTRAVTRAGTRTRVLVLGGTGEARELAARLTADGVPVVSSLAGRVSRPALPEGDVRVGGFGGVDGLATYLGDETVTHVVDATHPFADRISANAAAACALAGVPVVRLQRPGWTRHPLASSFSWVDSVDAAREATDGFVRPFVTTGRQQLQSFSSWDDRFVLVRVVEPPGWDVPASWEVLQARGPFGLDDELDLMRSRRVDVLLTKDSGGALTEPKLRAAHRLGMEVVVVRRPPVPDGLEVVETVDEAHTWLDS
jgi:precorrin-6A/cobalt-precorrin-6A reductase